MRNALLTLALLLTLTAAAQARIGETPDQLVARYGQPLKEEDQKPDGDKIPMAKVTFQKGGFQIDVTITSGLSQQEIFKKINGKPLTFEEAQTLVGDNSQGYNWSAPRKTDDGTVWVRDDNATAKLGGDGALTIRSHDLVAQETQAKQLEKKPSLDGF